MKSKKIIILILILITSLLVLSCNKFDYLTQDISKAPPLDPYKSKYYDKLYFYYPTKSLTRLAIEERYVNYSNKKIEEVLIEQLLAGTKNEEMVNIIPKKTKLLSVKTIGDVTYVNFSDKIQSKKLDEKEEAFVVYSIVNTLTQLDNVNSVQILIDGEIKDVLNNNYIINRPLYASNFIINRQYKSPVQVLYQFYNSIQDKDYISLKKLYYNSESVDFKTFFADTINVYEGMVDYEIKEYKINKYASNLSIRASIEIIKQNNSIINKYDETFYIINSPSGFKVDKIIVSENN